MEYLRLEVENSFINYFDKETEIYKGMKKIDDELGGTTPLEVIIKFPALRKIAKTSDDTMMSFQNGMKRIMMKNQLIGSLEIKLIKLIKVHDYLDSIPEIGKVMSFGSIIRVADDLNKKNYKA